MMSKRTLINLILLTLIVVLGLYIQKNPVETTQTQLLTTLVPDEINTIVIQRRDLTEIIFEKSQHDWKITSPFEAEADADKMKSLLSFLKLKSRHQQPITDKKQLQRFNLDQPDVSLFLNDQQFDFGASNDFNHYRYVLHKSTVHSVKDITYHLLNQDAESFVKK